MEVFNYNFYVAIGASSEIIQAFTALVRSEVEDERIDLLRAALTFARMEDPGLDVEHYVRRVDALAKRVAAKIQDPDDPQQMIAWRSMKSSFMKKCSAETPWTITVRAIPFFNMSWTANWVSPSHSRWFIWK